MNIPSERELRINSLIIDLHKELSLDDYNFYDKCDDRQCDDEECVLWKAINKYIKYNIPKK